MQCAYAMGASASARLVVFVLSRRAYSGGEPAFADRANGVRNYEQSYVLHTAELPALRMETGVIVTRESEQMLAGVQAELCAGIAEGIAH